MTFKIRAEKTNHSINRVGTTMQPHGKENGIPTHTKKKSQIDQKILTLKERNHKSIKRIQETLFIPPDSIRNSKPKTHKVKDK